MAGISLGKVKIVKYQVIDQEDDLVIKISGETRDNEPLLAKKMLSPYLKRRGVRLIVDLDGVAAFEPVALLGVLNGFRKEVDLLKGELKLRALTPGIKTYLKKNRLDRIFCVAESSNEGESP